MISIYVFGFVTRILFLRTIFSYWAKRASNRHKTLAPHLDYLKSDNLRILAAALLWRVVRSKEVGSCNCKSLNKPRSGWLSKVGGGDLRWVIETGGRQNSDNLAKSTPCDKPRKIWPLPLLSIQEKIWYTKTKQIILCVGRNELSTFPKLKQRLHFFHFSGIVPVRSEERSISENVRGPQRTEEVGPGSEKVAIWRREGAPKRAIKTPMFARPSRSKRLQFGERVGIQILEVRSKKTRFARNF